MVTRLWMALRSRSVPTSGAMATVRSPLSASGRANSSRTSSKRMDENADPEPLVAEVRDQRDDLPVRAHRGRDQPDAVGVGAGGAGERQQPLHLEGPLRQVVVAGPAEAAERRTAARHLDQELVRHLGVPGEDVGGRRAGTGRPCPSGPAPPDVRRGCGGGAPGRPARTRPRGWRARRTRTPPARPRRRASRVSACRTSVRAGRSASASPTPKASTKGASGSGFRKVTGPPAITSGSRAVRSSPRAAGSRRAGASRRDGPRRARR